MSPPECHEADKSFPYAGPLELATSQPPDILCRSVSDCRFGMCVTGREFHNGRKG